MNQHKQIKTSVLMVGMSLTKTRGGISTLISEILNSRLRDDFEFDYIESQAEDFGGARKALLAAKALATFAFKAVIKRPKLVHVHVGSNASLYRESLFIVAARAFGLRVATHFHAGDVDEYLDLQPALGRRFIARALEAGNLLIAVSHESASKLARIAPRANLTTIPNAIDARQFEAIERAKRGDATVKIVFVGAMGKLKGERDLADALAVLKPELPNLRVSFCGFGGDALAEYCREKGIVGLIDFVGAVAPEKRVAKFAEADIFVLPTYAEAMPMSVIEAMAAGLPVVSTTVGGIPELIDDGVEGFLFAPGDVARLAELIAKLASDEALRLEVGAKGREKAGTTMSFDVYTNRLRNAMLAAADAGFVPETFGDEIPEH